MVSALKNGKWVRLLGLMIWAAFLSGCVSTPRTSFEPVPPVSLDSQVESGQLKQNVNTLYVLLDASSSVADKYRESGFSGSPVPSEFAVEKEILRRLNQTIPSGLELTAALRSFGSLSCNDWQYTRLLYGPTAYTKSGFEEGLAKAECASGVTPIAKAIHAAAKDLQSTQAPIALLILSDGEDPLGDPVAAVQDLVAQYGDRLCVYTIGVSEDETNAATLAQIAESAKCGAFFSASDLSSGESMANFVKAMLLTEVGDSDGDGVPNSQDLCPDTPAGVPVDAKGCPKDSDGDGVTDDKDKCSQTPEGIRVNDYGCWVGGSVLFDFDKTEIRPEAHPLLDEVVEILKKHEYIKLEIQGHTDSIGSEAYNLKLSQRRADVVRDYLVSHGISPDRLVTKGYGESDPIASNETPEGRAKNRRVIFVPIE